GGVSPGEFARMTLVLCNTAFFSLATGVFVSSMSRHELKAVSATFFLLCALAIAPFVPLLLRLGPSANSSLLLYFSPIAHFAAAFERSFLRSPQAFWTMFGCIHLLGWLFLAVASAITLRVFHEKSPEQKDQTKKGSRGEFVRISPRAAK